MELKMRSLALLIFVFMLAGCVNGQWVKKDTNWEQTHKDIELCDSHAKIMGRVPATVYFGSAFHKEFVDCMHRKGYRWEE